MLAGRFFVSAHAVHRARQRLGIEGDFERARRWLIRGTKEARRIGYTKDLCEIWEATADFGGVRFIIRQFDDFPMPTVLTVIPNHYPIFVAPKKEAEVDSKRKDRRTRKEAQERDEEEA